jgi:hypothetical protein
MEFKTSAFYCTLSRKLCQQCISSLTYHRPQVGKVPLNIRFFEQEVENSAINPDIGLRNVSRQMFRDVMVNLCQSVIRTYSFSKRI